MSSPGWSWGYGTSLVRCALADLAFRAVLEPEMSREVSCPPGGASLCRYGPAFIISAAQPWESPRPELPRRWLGECSG